MHDLPMAAKSSTKRRPKLVPDTLGRGEGRLVTVKGTTRCTSCKGEIELEFVGASKSFGVTTTRLALKNGTLCVPCTDREDAEEFDRETAQRRAEHRLLRIERSGVPPRWQAVTFARLERDELRAPAFDAAAAWAQSDKPSGLLLYGAVGRGKTLIAAAAAMERLQRRRLRWLPVAKLLTDLRGGFDSPLYKAALAAIDSSSTDAALVLDDLDKLKPTDHSLQPLYVAINGWLERPLPLLVTMNRSPDELAEWAGESFGEALASRLVGYSEVVEVKGRDRRLG
jgi:DNA replication protein DnaC